MWANRNATGAIRGAFFVVYSSGRARTSRFGDSFVHVVSPLPSGGIREMLLLLLLLLLMLMLLLLLLHVAASVR